MTISSQYMHQVRRELACTPPCRKKFIRALEPLVDDFAGENPEASLSEYEEAFGAPEALAQQYMSTLDQEELSKYKRRRKLRRWVSWTIVAVIIVTMAVALLDKYTMVFEPPVTAEITTVIMPGMTIEEMKEILKEAGIKP